MQIEKASQFLRFVFLQLSQSTRAYTFAEEAVHMAFLHVQHPTLTATKRQEFRNRIRAMLHPKHKAFLIVELHSIKFSSISLPKLELAQVKKQNLI